MSNTQINGANINTDLLNKNLASKLIVALDCLQKSATQYPAYLRANLQKAQMRKNVLSAIGTANLGQYCAITIIGYTINVTKCPKMFISSIEKNDKTYQCKSCDSSQVNTLDTKKDNVPSLLKYHQSYITCTSPETQLKTYGNNIRSDETHITTARSLLIEENLLQCFVCDKALDDTENICPECK
ncbi:KRAB [Mytilus coruscus]|uniref:KRAB n=1 Tax=Mytilus coruscus TaxID=42192 RepID=A0A6J8A9T7_MYTCO|nr:KRAB [Mytilus coruscus]